VGGLTALVLAGTRQGGDPLAMHAGVTHKALIDIGGRAMLERVITALAQVPAIGRIVVAIEQPELLDSLALTPSHLGKPVSAIGTGAGPSATLALALAQLGTPLLVTTGDHALLEPTWVGEFMQRCPAQADIVAALAPRAAVQAAAPHTKRTYLRFSDGDFSGCNLFYLANPAAEGVIRFWQSMERDRKQPIRMIRKLGVSFALRYKLGWLSLTAASRRLGQLCNARVAFASLSDGRAAIDVDKPADLDLVREMVAGQA